MGTESDVLCVHPRLALDGPQQLPTAELPSLPESRHGTARRALGSLCGGQPSYTAARSYGCRSLGSRLPETKIGKGTIWTVQGVRWTQ